MIMTQEDRKLLLVDLCARLPYGVICDCLHDYHTKASAIDAEDSTVYYPYCDEWESIQYCKPYLRPMSSMTEEEKENLQSFHDIISDENYSDGYSPSAWDAITAWEDYCNSKHLDYRGLIKKELAIAVTEENNPYKE